MTPLAAKIAARGKAALDQQPIKHRYQRANKPPAPKVGQPLTGRQSDVFNLASQGMCIKEIAERLRLSHKTVTHHVGIVYKKLGVHSRFHLAKFSNEQVADILQAASVLERDLAAVADSSAKARVSLARVLELARAK